MDPNKSATAPPAEKSAVGAPPPYQDFGQYPNAGFQQPGPYPPQPGPAQPGPAQPGQAYPLMPGQAYPPYPQGYAPPSGPQYGAGPYGQPGQYPVTVQPTVFVTRAPLANPVNDYLGYSIFTMLCCCLPLGIAALIYSISTRDSNMAGDLQAAQRSSNTSRKLNHIALGCGLAILVISIVLMSI